MYYQIIKRLVDILGTILGITFLLPFLPLIALAIKLDSPGPVLVKLDRVSAGKRIKIYKFRTMKTNTHHLKYSELALLNERRDGPFFKIKNDPRLTRIGKILRKFRLDEFPQLINVLKGEISLIGPRPHEPEEIKHYPEEYKTLPLAKAGVTGLSQVSGASSLPFLKELKLDSYYVQNQSLWLDFKILAKTILILLFDPTAI
ncbi:MAG: sugar transferase [Candidatus Harrisonbacteria bacterium]|nr:sugar transferase [Candidatus Harrisonbacteria bacterium]